MSEYKTLREAKAALDAGEVTSKELADSSRKKISETDGDIHAWLEVFKEVGEGVPIGIKDLISTIEGHTTAASKMLENYRAPLDATVVRKLKNAGFSVLGKLNLDEFAMGSSTEYSAFGTTMNPHDTSRVAGGSSGGSAAAVAAGHVLAALGTDTGGSVRHPASFCGVVGLRPTYGRVSRFGVIAYGSSFDQVGPITNNVLDAAYLLEIIAGADPHEATSSPKPVGEYMKACTALANKDQPLKDRKIGLPKEFFSDQVPAEITEQIKLAVKKLESLGATLVEISLPLTPAAIPVYYLLAKAEAASNLGRFDSLRYAPQNESKTDAALMDQYFKNRGAGFGPEVKRTILMGTYALSAGYFDAWYKKASQVRTLIRREYDEIFQAVDIIAGPTVPEVAFQPGVKDALAMYLTDIFTTPASVAGLPAISIPAGKVDNLPVGLQFTAPAFAEESLLSIAHVLELTNAKN